MDFARTLDMHVNSTLNLYISIHVINLFHFCFIIRYPAYKFMAMSLVKLVSVSVRQTLIYVSNTIRSIVDGNETEVDLIFLD